MSFLGIISAEEYEKKGIPVKILDGKKIYPMYSVWSPTSQTYLQLLDQFIQTKYKYLKTMNSALDIGCGTGVLSIALKLNAKIKNVYAFDQNV
jgi:methylase of polypeptide subunit release factors